MTEPENAPRQPVERLALTIDEASVATTFSKAHLYRLMASGALRHSKVGRRTIIPVSAIVDLIEGKAA